MPDTAKRRMTLRATLELWSCDNDLDMVVTGYSEIPRWLLVEENAKVSKGYYLTLHETPEDAATYWRMQEQPELWEPLYLVDLEDRTVSKARKNVTFEAPTKLDLPEPKELKRYRVGNLMEFHAEDENHAVEQWYDAVTVESPDANFVEEVED